MKPNKLLLNLALADTMALNSNAQTPSLPNGNFEIWTFKTYEIPQNYAYCSNTDALRKKLPFNVIKSTDAYHGNYAVQMTTQISNGDSMPGIFVNVDLTGSNPATWHGGFAYNQKPSGMRGYYKSAIAAPDTGFILAFFYKSGIMIGQYGFYFYGTHSTYTPFLVLFSPSLAQIPDSIIFGAGSSNFNSRMRNGSMLKLDSISFTGVTSQPTLFNGDFETWKSTTIDNPSNWYTEGDNRNATGGAYKTTDAKGGNNAIELITYIGERYNNPKAQGGRISTGWYKNNCNNNCEQGGYPFSNQVDTLAFWYKYAPSSSDKAEVNLSFKKNGNNIWGTGINLLASPNYQYKEIPFNIGQIPDTVIVSAQSSIWQDSLLSFKGSSLKIDEMHFKSQPLKTSVFDYKNENGIRISPNPSSEKLTITIDENNGKQIDFKIFNTFGQQVFEQETFKNNRTSTLDISHFSEGIYFIRMTSGNQTVYDKKIIIAR